MKQSRVSSRECRPSEAVYTRLSGQKGEESRKPENIVSWLTQKENENDTLWIFSQVFMHCPQLWRKIAFRQGTQALEKRHSTKMKTKAAAFLASHLMTEDDDDDDEDVDKPLLLFASGTHIMDEGDEPCVQLDILREGDLQEVSTVGYTTVDGSAMAGAIYEATSGQVEFERGEDRKSIEVRLIPNNTWDATLEFKVRLQKEGVVNAILDPYMCETRIQVFNDDPFPTNDFKEILQDLRCEDVPKLALLRAYLHVMRLDPVVWSRTVKNMLLDMLHNIKLAAMLFMNVYLFDRILNVHESEEALLGGGRENSLFLLVGANVFLLLMVHISDFYKMRYLGLKGPLISSLKLSLLRHYFHCQHVFRADLGFTGLLQGMTQDAEAVVCGSYITMVNLWRNIGELMMLILFQCVAPVIFDTTFRPLPMIILSTFPLFMLSFLALRASLGHELLHRCAIANLAFCKFVDQTCSNFDMIFTFAKNDQVESKFQQQVKEFQTSTMLTSVFGLNNHYFAVWLSTVAISAYTVVGGMNVIHNVTSLGYLVTNLRIFAQMGTTWGEIYDNLTNIDAAFPALSRITNFLNTPTDLLDRQQAINRNEIMNKNYHACQIDERPIVVQGFGAFLRFRAGNLGGLSCTADSDDVEIGQGQMVAITSPSGCGKGTLLKLIGGLMFPSGALETHVFIPSHLRILAIGNVPLFFKGSIIDSLAFGVGASKQDARTDRIMKICQRLGIRQHVLKRIESKEEIVDWTDEFPGSTCQLLNIARALIANPDVLCLDKPTSGLDASESRKVLDALKECVDYKGLLQQTPQSTRRPRTVIYTTGRMLAVGRADMILHIDVSGDVRNIPPKKFKEEMMSHDASPDLLNSSAESCEK